MLATVEKGPLLRRPRAVATIGDRLREAQLQTRAASADILWPGMVKYPCQSLPEPMQAECQWRTGSGDSLIAFRLSSLTGSGKPERVAIRSTRLAKFHRSGGYGPGGVLKGSAPVGSLTRLTGSKRPPIGPYFDDEIPNRRLGS